MRKQLKKRVKQDLKVEPEIMIPLVSEVLELKYVKKVVVETADAEIAAAGVDAFSRCNACSLIQDIRL